MSRRWWLLAGLLSLWGLGSAAVAAGNNAKSVEPCWLSDWEEGRKEARVSGKPLFVVFRCQH